ncbi:MAG: hypothetical protein WCT01_02425 [Candidatus Shapirobacteria bacterium]
MSPPDIFPGRERKEALSKNIYPYLGGVFEATGSLRLDLRPSGNSFLFRPRWEFVDNVPLAVSRLSQLVPGSVKPIKRHANEYRWQAEPEVISTFWPLIEPYAPSRQATIDVFTLLREKINFPVNYHQAQRINQIIDDTLASSPLPSPEIYQPLVANPYFVAGVFDARANIINHNPDKRIRKPEMAIYLDNVPLLTALAGKFAGSVSPNPQQTSYRYVPHVNTTSDFLTFIAPCVQLKPELLHALMEVYPARPSSA